MAKYSHGNRSHDLPGEDGHVFAESTVNRSTRLKCEECDKPLPMGTRVVFELDSKKRFVAVYCNTEECSPHDFADDRHPFDLEA